MCLLNNKHDASLRVLGPMLHTNFHCHLSTSAAAAAIGALMLPLADAANSSISAFSLCITHSMASRPLKSAMHSVLLTAKVWPCLGCVWGGLNPRDRSLFLAVFLFSGFIYQIPNPLSNWPDPETNFILYAEDVLRITYNWVAGLAWSSPFSFYINTVNQSYTHLAIWSLTLHPSPSHSPSSLLWFYSFLKNEGTLHVSCQRASTRAATPHSNVLSEYCVRQGLPS